MDSEKIRILHDLMSDEQFIGYCKGHALEHLIKAGIVGNEREEYQEAFDWMTELHTSYEISSGMRKEKIENA